MNPNVKTTASYIPGTTAWTMAVFEAADVPEGTKVQPVQQPAPVAGQLHAQAINALLAVATAACDAMDNSEERANPNGGEDAEYVVQGNDFEALSSAMDLIDALPNDRPNYTLSGGARAGWALRELFAAPSLEAQPAGEIVNAVAKAIFKVIKPSNMTDKDWDGDIILGLGNAFRDQIKEAAKAAINAMAQGDKHE